MAETSIQRARRIARENREAREAEERAAAEAAAAAKAARAKPAREPSLLERLLGRTDEIDAAVLEAQRGAQTTDSNNE